ncbi:MAG: DUF1800 domain-containing protein [Acidimicrobiales bacterium]
MEDQALGNIALLYRRAGFGARPEEVEAGVTAGYEATVESLLAGTGSAPDPGGDQVSLPPMTPPSAGGARAGAGKPAGGDPPGKAARAALHAEDALLQNWWLDRMIATSTPLREKLTLLWHGHFATGITKVRFPELMYRQNQLFRRQGAGSFEGLTQAVAKDPAMMLWLDTARDKSAHPNENFGRELMERLTLGVGNYGQADVTGASQAFTGWSLSHSALGFVYHASQHYRGPITFLGHTGSLSGEDVIDIICHRPESARFVVAGLWSHLAYPVTTSDPVVRDLTPSYSPTAPLTALLRAIFLHPAFLSQAATTGLVKQPAEYLAGAARALGLDAGLQRRATPPGDALPATGKTAKVRLAEVSTVLGQTLFNPPNVGGWPQNGYWLDTATSLTRLRAGALLARAADLSSIESVAPAQRPAAVATLLSVRWGPTTEAALAHAAGDPAALVALALSSPEYVMA